MTRKTRKLHLKLENKNLYVWVVNDDGKRGGRFEWGIRETGKLPSAFFYLLLSYVRRRMSECQDEDLIQVRKAVRAGLREAARACGCKRRRKCAGADVVFYLKAQPLIAFVIPKDPAVYKPGREFLQSEAIFRWVVDVRSKKYFKFVPLHANKNWCD